MILYLKNSAIRYCNYERGNTVQYGMVRNTIQNDTVRLLSCDSERTNHTESHHTLSNESHITNHTVSQRIAPHSRTISCRTYRTVWHRSLHTVSHPTHCILLQRTYPSYRKVPNRTLLTVPTVSHRSVPTVPFYRTVLNLIARAITFSGVSVSYKSFTVYCHLPVTD